MTGRVRDRGEKRQGGRGAQRGVGRQRRGHFTQAGHTVNHAYNHMFMMRKWREGAWSMNKMGEGETNEVNKN